MRPLRILFVAPYVPSRLRPRSFHFLRGLAASGHHVSAFAVATSEAERMQAVELEPVLARLTVVRIGTARSLWRCVRGLAGRAPLQALYGYSPSMDAMIAEELRASAYDVLHVEHLRASLYGRSVPGVARVYDAVDCMTRLHAHARQRGPTLASRAAGWLEGSRTRRFEADGLERFDRVVVSAGADRAALVELAGRPDAASRIRVLPNGVDLDYFRPSDAPRDPATLVFVGRLAYHANLAAAYRLLDAIMPRVWARRPEARLLLVGADPPRSLRMRATRAGSRVAVTGTVPDVRPYLARATVSVNPLPYAVGIQNKVLEAMATATPVVVSPAACAALGTVDGEHVLVGAGADACARHVVRLLDDAALQATLGAAGRCYVEIHHDWRPLIRSLEDTYAEAIEVSRAGGASWS